MKTKFGYVLRGPISKVHNNQGSTLICHSLKWAAEISDTVFCKRNSKIFGISNALTLKLTTPLFIKALEDIRYSSNEASYEIRLPFKDDSEILPDNFTHCKHRLSN